MHKKIARHRAKEIAAAVLGVSDGHGPDTVRTILFAMHDAGRPVSPAEVGEATGLGSAESMRIMRHMSKNNDGHDPLIIPSSAVNGAWEIGVSVRRALHCLQTLASDAFDVSDTHEALSRLVEWRARRLASLPGLGDAGLCMLLVLSESPRVSGVYLRDVSGASARHAGDAIAALCLPRHPDGALAVANGESIEITQAGREWVDKLLDIRCSWQRSACAQNAPRPACAMPPSSMDFAAWLDVAERLAKACGSSDLATLRLLWRLLGASVLDVSPAESVDPSHEASRECLFSAKLAGYTGPKDSMTLELTGRGCALRDAMPDGVFCEPCA